MGKKVKKEDIDEIEKIIKHYAEKRVDETKDLASDENDKIKKIEIDFTNREPKPLKGKDNDKLFIRFPVGRVEIISDEAKKNSMTDEEIVAIHKPAKEEEYKIITEEEFYRLQRRRQLNKEQNVEEYSIDEEKPTKKITLTPERKELPIKRFSIDKSHTADWEANSELFKSRQDIDVISKLFKNRESFKTLYEQDSDQELRLKDLTTIASLTDEALWIEALERYRSLFKAMNDIEDELSKAILGGIFGSEIKQLEDYIFAKNNFDFKSAQEKANKLAELQKKFPKKPDDELSR